MMKRFLGFAVISVLGSGFAIYAHAQSDRKASSPPAAAPTTIAPLPLTGKLLMSDAERAQLNRARRSAVTVRAPRADTDIAEVKEQHENESSAGTIPKPRRAITNGFVKRADGTMVVWLNGRPRDVSSAASASAVTPASISEAANVAIKLQPSREASTEK